MTNDWVRSTEDPNEYVLMMPAGHVLLRAVGPGLGKWQVTHSSYGKFFNSTSGVRLAQREALAHVRVHLANCVARLDYILTLTG